MFLILKQITDYPFLDVKFKVFSLYFITFKDTLLFFLLLTLLEEDFDEIVRYVSSGFRILNHLARLYQCMSLHIGKMS